MSLSYFSIGIIIYISFLIFALGTIFGSFCNAWAWRIVNHENITKGRSHCTSCGHVLTALDLIPIFSYVFLKGRCRYCKEKISIRYPATELISGLYYVSIFLTYGFSIDCVRIIALGSILLTASLVDIDIMELPDGLMIAGAVLSLLRLLTGTGIAEYLLGLLPAIALILIVLIMNRLMKKDTMGGGDIKLLAVLGLHYSLDGALFILLCSCILGLIFAYISGRRKSQPFPFGPSLALASWIMALTGEKIIEAYLSLFTL